MCSKNGSDLEGHFAMGGTKLTGRLVAHADRKKHIGPENSALIRPKGRGSEGYWQPMFFRLLLAICGL